MYFHSRSYPGRDKLERSEPDSAILSFLFPVLYSLSPAIFLFTLPLIPLFQFIKRSVVRVEGMVIYCHNDQQNYSGFQTGAS